MKKTKVYLLSMIGSTSVVCFNKEEIIDHIASLEESDSGDAYTVKITELTEEQLRDMPEFDGF